MLNILKNSRNNALIPKPSSALEKVAPGAKRVLGLMISETLAIAQRRNLSPLSKSKTEIERWYRLAQSYYNGDRVPQDYLEAAKWFRLAAEHGHALAQYYFGICIHYGRGVQEDYVEAIRWYRKSGAQGVDAYANLAVCYVWQKRGLPADTEVKAQIGLGDRYIYGYDVPQDDAAAIKCYLKAVELGDNTGLYNLAFRYSEPLHAFQPDFVEALKWFKIVADTEKDKFGKKFVEREIEVLSTKMAAEQVQESERRYREFLTSKN